MMIPMVVLAPSNEPATWLGASHYWSVVLVLLGAGLLWLAVKSMLAADEARHGPLLRRMCRELGIDRRGRRVLHRIASTTKLASPVSLVLSRGCFDHAARRAILGSQERAGLDELRRRLFGQDAAAS